SPSSYFSTLLLIMRRSPPCTTLFPYTTLFRSLGGSICARPGLGVLSAGYTVKGKRQFNDGNPRSLLPEKPCGARYCRCRATIWPDRKSTRLNSSHDQISYAVFCLKKKKYN